MILWTAAYQASLSFTISQSLLRFMSIETVMLLTISFSAILFSFSLQSFLSSGSFLNESALHIRWPKYWSFNFSIRASNECSGLILFRINRFDLAVQWALKNLFQHHNLKASVLQHSAFLMVHLSHSYMTTGKTIALTISSVVKTLSSSISYNILNTFT